MDSSTVLIIAIPALLILAAVAIVAEGRRRSTTGRLSRETRKSDRSMPAGEAPAPEPVGTELAELDEEARARAQESRQALEPTGARAPVEYVPVEEEELGLTRRQFFNRGILTGLGIFAAGLGAAMLGFLWPGSAGVPTRPARTHYWPRWPATSTTTLAMPAWHGSPCWPRRWWG